MFDVLIQGGEVVGGERHDRPERADVGINGGRIQAVGDLANAAAARVIDASGLTIAPGFIDVHVHSEIALLGGKHRHAGLLQGVTTQLMAPDGFGWAPLGSADAAALWDTLYFSVGMRQPRSEFPTVESYLSLFDRGIPGNLVPQVPHCALRTATVGWDNRGPTSSELERMKELVAQWMDAGAVSLCLGLDYQPSAFATTDELIELAKTTREMGGIYAAHIRYNRLGREGAWRETLEVSRRAEIPVHVSHEVVDDLSEAMLADGDDITFESYLYPAKCTHLTTVLPSWAQEDGAPGLRDRLKDWAFRYEISSHLEEHFSSSLAKGESAVFADTPTRCRVSRLNASESRIEVSCDPV
ncbi:MAG: amidohydrolase family protein [Trueperaceae bacterium]